MQDLQIDSLRQYYFCVCECCAPKIVKAFKNSVVIDTIYDGYCNTASNLTKNHKGKSVICINNEFGRALRGSLSKIVIWRFTNDSRRTILREVRDDQHWSGDQPGQSPRHHS